MRCLDKTQIEPDDIAAAMQEADTFKAYQDISRRIIPGNVAYVFLFFWMLYATSFLDTHIVLTLASGVTILMMSIARTYLGLYLDRFRGHLNRWCFIFSTCTLIMAATWSMLSVYAVVSGLKNPAYSSDIMLITILVFAIVMGGMNVLAIIPALWKSFLFILTLPITISLFVVATPDSIALGLLFILATLFVHNVGKSICSDYWQRLKNESMLKLQTEALSQARDAALAAGNAKSAFLANMSHEIRTPMNGVLGMADLLLSTELTHKQSSFATAIKRSGDALLLIINDILDFSKIDAGKMELHNSFFCLRTLIEDVADLLSEQAFNKHIEIITQLSPALPYRVSGDQGRLRQVLVNLAANAVKFTDIGEVLITVKEVRRHNGCIYLQFSIRDTGIGIKPEHQKDVFNAFSQSDTSATRKYGGSGLGLSISAQLISMMNGEICLQSELGIGSVFSFELALPLEAEGQPKFEALWHKLQGKRALIVDDNLTLCHELHHQMQSFGINSTTLQLPQQAIPELSRCLADNKPYDVVVIDMHMPSMDGLELTRAIRAQTTLVSLPVIILTSGSMDNRQANTSTADIHAYCLPKPVRQSPLLTALAQVLLFNADKNVRPVLTLTDTVDAHILLAEDNEVNKMVAQATLEGFGCILSIAGNGQEAIDIFLKGGIDIILMDCQMPGLDGYEATERIRKLEHTAGYSASRIPIIALTARAMQTDKEACLQAGMDDYLSKPFSQEQLREKLRLHLPDHNKPAVESNPETQANGDANRGLLDVQEISQLLGNNEKLHKLLRLFLDNLAKLMADMHAGIEQADANLVMFASHTLKSSSAMIGAMDLSALCKDIESITRQNELAGVEYLVQEAGKAGQLVAQEIRTVYLQDDLI